MLQTYKAKYLNQTLLSNFSCFMKLYKISYQIVHRNNLLNSPHNWIFTQVPYFSLDIHHML